MFSKPNLRIAILATLACLPAAERALAYEVSHHNLCNGVTWYSNPSFRIATVSFDTAGRRAAIYDTVSTIGLVGDQTLDFSLGQYPGTWTALGNEHNDVFAAPFSQYDMADYAGWTRRKYRPFTCRFDEADVIFDSGDPFVFGIPENHDKPFWWTGYREGPNGTKYLRMVSLHEFLHAAGLGHEDNTWAIMNYESYPWRNRSTDQMMAPLPDDRRGLRFLYPSSGTERNVAVVNTYVDVSQVGSDGAANGRKLCMAAAGGGFSAGNFPPADYYCSDPSFVHVCPGDRVYTRFSIANDGTVAADVDERLYFSSDFELSPDDIPSPTIWSKSVDGGKHFRDGHSFAVPAGLVAEKTYYLILKLESDLVSESSLQDNWIPAGGGWVKGTASCP